MALIQRSAERVSKDEGLFLSKGALVLRDAILRIAPQDEDRD
jgi:hypothetical protein